MNSLLTLQYLGSVSDKWNPPKVLSSLHYALNKTDESLREVRLFSIQLYILHYVFVPVKQISLFTPPPQMTTVSTTELLGVVAIAGEGLTALYDSMAGVWGLFWGYKTYD